MNKPSERALKKAEEIVIYYLNQCGGSSSSVSKEELDLIESIATALDAEAAPNSLSDEELTKLAIESSDRCPACGEDVTWQEFFKGYRLSHGEEV